MQIAANSLTSPMATALGGLNRAGDAMQAAAEGTARIGTAAPSLATGGAPPPGASALQAQMVADPLRAMLGVTSARLAYRANLAVVRTADEATREALRLIR